MIGRRRLIGMVILGSACWLGGCDDTTDFGSLYEIRNIPDTFEFLVSELEHVTRTSEYPWENSGAAVSVYQSTALTAGTARLVILDAGGTQVYSRSLAENGTFDSTAGTPGMWTIRVIFTGATGTVTFRVLTAAP